MHGKWQNEHSLVPWQIDYLCQVSYKKYTSVNLKSTWFSCTRYFLILVTHKYFHFQLCVGTTVNDTLEGVIMIHLLNKSENYTDTLLIWILWKFDMKHAEQHWLSGPFRKGFPFLAISDDVLQCIWCAQQSLNIYRLWLSGNPKGKRWT